MPKLGEYQYLLDAVFFLYKDEASAKAGKGAGGTGFFVGIESQAAPDTHHHIYAVSNWHVAVDGFPVIRVNRKSGPPEIFPFDVHDWTFVPGGEDVAVVEIQLNDANLKASALSAMSWFVTDERIAEHEMNAGEDVFMLGRFIDHDGVEANLPSMRFGNISMMAAKVKQPTGFVGESYVVDMHSRTGFSGSPVFVYRTQGSIFSKPGGLLGGGHLMMLLGILWGQFPEEWNIQDSSKAVSKQGATLPTLDGKSIRGMSGMSLVSPASAIRKVLNMKVLRDRRAETESALREELNASPVSQAAPAANAESPTHREDFMNLLGAAVKTPQPKD